MTIGEFKAFLEGMDIQGTPTPEQWARIKEKLDGLCAGRTLTNLQPSPYIPAQWYSPPTYAPDRDTITCAKEPVFKSIAPGWDEA